ncbi:MAG TPA: sialate O-acetylesterase [Nitratidesulfovibrio sp.]|nr:sialate O-acetylesterase [Nitratidesulfovibrio sp.]
MSRRSRLVRLLAVPALLAMAVLLHAPLRDSLVGLARYTKARLYDYRLFDDSDLVTDVSAREPVPLERLADGNTLYVLVMGQSNAANEVDTPLPSDELENVFIEYDGTLYPAEDPMLGGTGERGSVWSRFARLALATGRWRYVVLSVIAEGGSPLAYWLPGGPVRPKLEDRLRAIQQLPIRPDYVFWFHGESDALNSLPRLLYKYDFLDLVGTLRTFGIENPVLVSQTSLCRRYGAESVRQAQQELARQVPNVTLGPDTDEVGLPFRRDGCHFTDEGGDIVAGLWMDAMLDAEHAAE